MEPSSSSSSSSQLLLPLCDVSNRSHNHSVFDFTTWLPPVTFSLICILGFLGNSLVLAVIVKHSQMRTHSTNILICSLSLADMLFILICIPFTAATYAWGGWRLGKFWCQIFQYFSYLSVYCSVYTLVCMSVDRYIAVVHPTLTGTWRTPGRAMLVTTLLWALFMLTLWPLFQHSAVVSHVKETEHCRISYCTYTKLTLPSSNNTQLYTVENKSYGRIFFGSFFIFAYLLPLLVISLLYSLLLKKLRCRGGAQGKLPPSRRAIHTRKRVTRLVIAVVLTFAVCWLPIQMIFLLQYFGPDPDYSWMHVIHIVANCLSYGNSCVNPILYAFLSENFRNAFKRFLSPKRGEKLLVNAPAGRLLNNNNNINNSNNNINIKNNNNSNNITQQTTRVIKFQAVDQEEEHAV